MEPYRPQSRYFLVDEGGFSDTERASLRKLSAALFRLENSRTPHHVEQVLAALVDWLKEPEQTSLRRAFTVWRNGWLIAFDRSFIDHPLAAIIPDYVFCLLDLHS